MSLFGKKKTVQQVELPPAPVRGVVADVATLARTALDSIKDGVLIIDQSNCIKLINPAALTLTGELDADLVLGMNADLSIRLEDENGTKIPDETNPVFHALKTNQLFESHDLILISKENNKKIPIEISVIPTGSIESDRIVTLRDISREKSEGDAQFEFISTASHEMRTPVASIEGYLGLALNPQTATIDERARGYLEAAHKSSEHLGKLFQDLLDVTKLDDQKIQPHFIPIELTSFTQQLTRNFAEKAREKNLSLIFGPKTPLPSASKTLAQTIYAYVDERYLNEIISNLIENAIKYTPNGKTIWVNVTSDDNRAIVLVEDTGIGITGSDQQHVFQKFYRADNSQTREIGGTGLGLYLVKKRTEALHGSVWVESVYGQGSTFYVAFPRLSPAEYQKRKIQSDNEIQLLKDEQMRDYQQAMSSQSVVVADNQQTLNQAVQSQQFAEQPTSQSIVPQQYVEQKRAQQANQPQYQQPPNSYNFENTQQMPQQQLSDQSMKNDQNILQ